MIAALTSDSQFMTKFLQADAACLWVYEVPKTVVTKEFKFERVVNHTARRKVEETSWLNDKKRRNFLLVSKLTYFQYY